MEVDGRVLTSLQSATTYEIGSTEMSPLWPAPHPDHRAPLSVVSATSYVQRDLQHRQAPHAPLGHDRPYSGDLHYSAWSPRDHRSRLGHAKRDDGRRTRPRERLRQQLARLLSLANQGFIIQRVRPSMSRWARRGWGPAGFGCQAGCPARPHSSDSSIHRSPSHLPSRTPPRRGPP